MQPRSKETQQRLLDAALVCFSSQGYEATSVEQICDTAGLSKGAFYHHFASKQSLFLKLMDNWLATIGAGLEAARKDDIPQTFIHMTDMLPSVFTLAGQHLPMFLEFWLQASRDPAVWQAMIAPYHRYQEFFAGLVARGTAEGSFKPVDPQVAGQAIVSMAVGLLLQGSLDPQGADWPKVARESIQIIIDSISHDNKTEEE